MTARRITLEELARHSGEDGVLDLEPPYRVELTLTERPAPEALKNLARLGRLGLLNGDALLSLVGQAPVDPVNLVGTLMGMHPEGWAFSAVDFAMFRVLSKTTKGAVASALRVDLMSNVIQALVLNQKNQLVPYKTLEVEAREGMLEQIQGLVNDAIAAARREGHNN